MVKFSIYFFCQRTHLYFAEILLKTNDIMLGTISPVGMLPVDFIPKNIPVPVSGIGYRRLCQIRLRCRISLESFHDPVKDTFPFFLRQNQYTDSHQILHNIHIIVHINIQIFFILIFAPFTDNLLNQMFGIFGSRPDGMNRYRHSLQEIINKCITAGLQLWLAPAIIIINLLQYFPA